MKRVLIITYYWPPTAGSGVQRWLKFSKYLSRFGWECVVYTPESIAALADILREDLGIVRDKAKLEKGIEDFLRVCGIAVEGVNGPARFAGGEGEGLRTGDFHACDVSDVERGEDFAAYEVWRLLGASVLEPHCRADEGACCKH